VKLVLDTNAYCDYAEGIPNTVDVIAIYGDEIFLPSIVIGELIFGFMKGSRQKFNERKLQEFLKKLHVETIDVNQNVSRKYALIYLSLVKKGKKIPINDVWIAACCMEVGGTLLTRDRHFQHVEQIEAMVLDT
jgi:predicted nucleic acid-binding protein